MKSIFKKGCKKKNTNLEHWTTKSWTQKNYVNEKSQCKTWQKAQWYGWWITQTKNIAKQGGCIIDANMNLNMMKDILLQIL
jgi:hypothetical protein